MEAGTTLNMAKSRANQKQVWLDELFADELEKLQAKKRLLGKKISMGDLSREIIQAKSWESLEKEILDKDKATTKNALKIKFDGSIYN